MKKILILLACLTISCIVFSQDKIYKKGGEIINAKIVEIGTDEIKYKLFDKEDGPIYALERESVIKIVYSDGRVELYKSNFKDPELYKDQPKNALKVNFLSPLFGHLMFSFEHSIQPGRSWEANVSFIGLGKNYPLEYDDVATTTATGNLDAKGIAVGFGYKFLRLPDFTTKGLKFTHILQGSYIKPTLYFGTYTQNQFTQKSGQTVVENKSNTFGSLVIELGKQWVFSDKVTLDCYFGLGYVVDNVNHQTSGGEPYSTASNYTVIRIGESPGFGINGGIKIGILLK